MWSALPYPGEVSVNSLCLQHQGGKEQSRNILSVLGEKKIPVFKRCISSLILVQVSENLGYRTFK